jgi:hypothetical protein
MLTLSEEDQQALNAKFDQVIDQLEMARAAFLPLDGVIGVGWGVKETNGELHQDQPSIIVYVWDKKDTNQLSSEERIPGEFNGVPTDVVAHDERTDPHQREIDEMWLDRGHLHAMNPGRDVHLEPAADFDLDDVAILEIDDTFVTNGKIDFVKAVKRFLINHPDAFDFIAFYVHTASGLPGQGSWHSGVYNKTKGINYYAGHNLDIRATYGSTKLQAVLSLGWLGNAVLLQEFGHMWGAFVRNRDTQTSALLYDLLIGPTGQGKFHWGRFFDNHHSPMDYDGIDWQALGGGKFQSHGIADNFFHFHPLDFYLMGLIPANQVGSFYVIKNPSGQSGTITGTAKNITTQNVIWAEGPRDPAFPNTQKVWKQAFVVLTKDVHAARPFAEQVAAQRRKFTWETYKGTRFLGKADTTLRSYVSFPQVTDISVATDSTRAIVGWKTAVGTKGKVNFATSPAAFQRDQAHTTPYTTASDTLVRTSHGILLTGLTPNSTYRYEVLAETREGLVDRAGVLTLYTRKTKDKCAPDINNVHAVKSPFFKNKAQVSWKTDESSDSRVFYGTSAPPTQQRYDPYPTTSHSMTLSGLSAGTYFVSVQSRDAAGNTTLDDNGSAYYKFVIPVSAPARLEAVTADELSDKIATIGSAVASGHVDDALHLTSDMIADVAARELDRIAEATALPEDNLDAGCVALQELAARLGSTIEIEERDGGYLDLRAEPDPLFNLQCVDLPDDVVAEEAGYPLLENLPSGIRPNLRLEAHPTRGPGHYRLSRTM